jgi:hypothetical protein
MSIETLSAAATISLAGAGLFALIARSWHALSRRAAGAGYFADCILSEAAERFRVEHERERRRQVTYLASGLVFLLAFAALALMPQRLFDGLALWQLAIVLAAVGIAGAFAVYRAARNAIALRHLGYLRDANIAIGHGLQKIRGNLTRVFHDVPCGGEVIDDVLVGLHGVYAVYVLARRPGKRNAVRLRGDRLAFAPGRHVVSVAPYVARSERLSAQLAKVLKHPVRVRTVIAVPGWEIEEQAGHDCLMVNEQNLVMIRGWKDRQDYLLNEDVEALHELLAGRCVRAGRSKPAWG